MKKKVNIALIGNPNCGKTTIFNQITGFKQKTGNYPGVTIEKKQGSYKEKDIELAILDLPGIYDLHSSSLEEKLTQNELLTGKPDIIINIVDSTNLEKSLLLTAQLKKLNVPIVLALNMSDLCRKKKIFIDLIKLSSILKIDVVEVIANKKIGIKELIQKSIDVANRAKNSSKSKKLAFLEDDNIEERHEFVARICKKIVSRKVKFHHSRSDMIDGFLTHRIFGLPIFLLIMFLVFQVTFYIGSFPTLWIEKGISLLSTTVSSLFYKESLIKALLVDGVIGGVGAVLIYLPNILLLFLSISILEDSGYMARAAYLLDRIMHKIGLNGKAFIPMIIGFGCSVPAIMATRTLESKKDRLILILVLPLIACSAKLVVFMLFIPPFFSPILRPVVLLSLYVIGIALSFMLIKLFNITLFKKRSSSFIMEFPPYRKPLVKSIFMNMWNKGSSYIKKAGTLILGFSILLWILSAFPKSDNKNEKVDNYLSKIGHFIEPVFKPIGFDWKINTSLISSFAAKEVFIAQLGVIYSTDEGSGSKALQEKLMKDYTPLQAYLIMLFILISSPCIATFAITKKETGSYKWAFLQLIGLTMLGYISVFIVYQLNKIYNMLEDKSLLEYIIIGFIALAALIFVIRRLLKKENICSLCTKGKKCE